MINKLKCFFNNSEDALKNTLETLVEAKRAFEQDKTTDLFVEIYIQHIKMFILLTLINSTRHLIAQK